MTQLIDLAIRSSAMLAAGLLFSACLSKRSAALRHRVLAPPAHRPCRWLTRQPWRGELPPC